MTDRLKDALARWQTEILEPALQEQAERQKAFRTSSGLELDRLYLPADPDPDYLDQLGFPGEYPFTRGVQPTMYRGRLWTMRQYAGFATAEETNRRFHYLLEQGQTGLSVAFDLPTQIGYDADDPLALGEVGRVGVSISSLQDMERLLDGLPLERVSTSMTINAPAAVLLAMYLAVAQRRGIDANRLRGTIQNDVLKEYVARGTYIFPPQPAMRLVTDVFRYCKDHVPRWNTISISGYHIREAGATAAQEIAFTLADAIAYTQAALTAGLSVDEFAPQLAFFFASHNHLLEEVAKFRAARRLWAHIMRDDFGAQDSRSWRLRFHTQTGGSTLTARQPVNNVVRVTLQALAAVLGGTQSLHTNSMDEALSLPTEEAVQVALRTQQILAHETGIADTIDPLGGAYAIEALTDAIERQARQYLRRIAEMGGALAAVENGFMQREIQEAAYQAQRELETGENVVVGVNRYASGEAATLPRLRIDPSIEQAQRKRLGELRARRDAPAAEQALDRLTRAVAEGENLIPLFIDCLNADLTLGEICGRLRVLWGEYQPSSTL
jgi:methylmalonyl-CoA mutase N-terminal domain/subunit